jgi:hypothetical protein
MLKLLRTIFSRSASTLDNTSSQSTTLNPPTGVIASNGQRFNIAASLTFVHDLPTPDWNQVSAWVETFPTPEEQSAAWTACERAWLEHLGAALGDGYHLTENDQAIVLSTLEPKVAKITTDFIAKTLKRITRVLDGITHIPPWGKDLLIVLDDDDAYYQYVSRYYPDEGEFAFSGGMHISGGCSHFVTKKADLREIEPVIVHEMTHGCLSHLPIPAWLNEGIAVNTEQILSPSPRGLYTPHEMHAKHLKFWGPAEIQEFWSGKSFLRTDDGNMLSYDLARIVVEQFSRHWDSFRPFVLNANASDGGARAAAEHLGTDLGDVVSALLEQAPGPAWSPDPSKWSEPPERGAFRAG